MASSPYFFSPPVAPPSGRVNFASTPNQACRPSVFELNPICFIPPISPLLPYLNSSNFFSFPSSSVSLCLSG